MREQDSLSPLGSRQSRYLWPRFRPADAKAFLREWCLENIDSPYPTDAEKLDICTQTSLTLTQVNNWSVTAARTHLPNQPLRSSARSTLLSLSGSPRSSSSPLYLSLKLSILYALIFLACLGGRFTNWRKRFWKLEIAARLSVEVAG